MKSAPKFRYFVSDTRQAVQEGSDLWHVPIPLVRQSLQVPSGLSLSHGDYFSAIRDVLCKEEFKLLLSALSQSLRRSVPLEEIKEIRIVLEKHGEFYHPARVETILQEATLSFVLNVAVSESGKKIAEREYQTLQKLQADFSFAFLPKVYGRAWVDAQGGRPEMCMFMGEWFEGYHEFHISRDPADNDFKIVLWDSLQGNFFLTAEQTRALYRQIAKILTCYFNLATFEHISAWHHAAGDFVVKCNKDHLDVKLVTVRQYVPMFAGESEVDFGGPDAVMVLEALLVFFLNLALRIRLDRLDGIGEIVWADKTALEPTLHGVLDALALKTYVNVFAEPLVDVFRKHLLSCNPLDLLDLNRAIVQKYHPRSRDVAVIQKHLEQHVSDLYDVIQNDRYYT